MKFEIQNATKRMRKTEGFGEDNRSCEVISKNLKIKLTEVMSNIIIIRMKYRECNQRLKYESKS